jgi:hypothetical protein
MRVIGSPVDNAGSWPRELAALFASRVHSEAEKFVRRRALTRDLEADSARIQELKQVVEQADANKADLERRLDVARQRPLPGLVANQVLALVLAGVVVVIGLITEPVIIGVGALAFVAIIVISSSQRTAHTGAVQRDEAALSQEYAGVEQIAQAASAEWKALHERVTAMRTEFENTVPQRTLRAVARAYYPVQSSEVAGYPVLIDRSGSAPTVSLKVADLALDPEAIASIRERLDAAKQMPVLVRPTNDGEFSAMDTIHGEELALKGAVHDFGEMIGRVPTIEERLPLIEKGSPLARYIMQSGKKTSDMSVPGTVLGGSDASIASSAARLSDVSVRMRQVGKNIAEAFRAVERDMGEVLTAYGEHRSNAVKKLHDSIEDVLTRSDLPYTNCYCPKCNRVPAYLFHRLEIDLDTAHTLAPAALLEALQHDDETRTRIVENPELLQKILQGWRSVQELETSIQQVVAAKESNQASLGQVASAFGPRLRALRSQHDQLVRQFQAALRHAVTGSPRPQLDLSREARLYLDPDTNAWTCGACNTTFDDPEVVRMGRLLRVKDELLMPLWNHLWTEKDDFRKSELFRTNEQIQQLNEREATALREVSEQYRADMRPVRENLILATSDATVRRDRLEATVQSLAALGVYSAAEARHAIAKLADVAGGDLSGYKAHAEEKETLLNLEPSAQIARRIQAIDPVNMLMSPESLFREEATGRAVVKLVES